MNKQINPDHCYKTEDGVTYMLAPARGTPEWHVLKDGRKHRSFTSLMAAKGWLEHVLEHGEQTKLDDDTRRRNTADAYAHKPRVIVAGGGSAEFKAKLAAALNGGVK
jgi:hypothetical protein